MHLNLLHLLQLLSDMDRNVMINDMHPEQQPAILEDKVVDNISRNHQVQEQVVTNFHLKDKSV